MRNVLKRIAKKIVYIDEKGKSILNFLVDKPMKSRKEVYFERYNKEMTKKRYEEERFYLVGLYWILLLVLIFAVQSAVRGLFL